ncbi:hypothetical protein [Arachidicoccus sp.]|uniref:hypothetical protein n=1 Tax=Arachidicoccus sp. TaxID=1872624 RepID=UPI003D2611EF
MWFKTEAKNGLSILDWIRQENVLLKNRLSNAVQQEVNKSYLARAEHFQQKFIEKDQIVELLRHEINTLLMSHYNHYHRQETSLMQKKFHLLKRDIEKVKDEFELLKLSFEQYLLN